MTWFFYNVFLRCVIAQIIDAAMTHVCVMLVVSFTREHIDSNSALATAAFQICRVAAKVRIDLVSNVCNHFLCMFLHQQRKNDDVFEILVNKNGTGGSAFAVFWWFCWNVHTKMNPSAVGQFFLRIICCVTTSNFFALHTP